VKSIPSVLDRKGLIAATSWSWQGIAASLAPDVLVDTRTAAKGSPENLRARAPQGLLTLGCGPAIAADGRVDIVIDTGFPDSCAAGGSSERLLRAPRPGRMRSQFRIGELVEAHEPIGDVNGAALLAPVGGVLRGLSARGARVAAGQIVIDVDPRGDPAACYGIDPWAARVAARVIGALDTVGLAGVPMMPPIRAVPLREPM
jgi:xanthine dehydrogenase accessory factor